MKKHLHVIKSIEPGSIAEEMELMPGDTVLAINGQEIEDVFDYHFLINDEYIEMLIRTADGEEELLEIEKDYNEDMGIVFDSSLMDDYKSCSNQCIFCFIDQLPKGMRETMYFKDDDSRLSFLQGNYITMTNMKDSALERIIRYKLEPINVSVHTTNPELRCMMLHNRFAGKIMEQLQKLYDGGIIMNAQIVLCRGVNDGEELDRTIRDLSGFIPNIESVSVVPVGLSDYREGLYPLEPFEAEDARRVIAQIEEWQKRLYEEYGTHFIHASDEWYLLAGYEMPEEERYDGYLQLENGVGMVRLLMEEFHEALDSIPADGRKRHVSIATGRSAAGHIRRLAGELCDKFENMTVDVYEIVNHFFGEKITVSGLLTGKDIMEQLKGLDLGDRLLLPVNILRSGEDIELLLDDVTVPEIENALQIPISIVQSNGQDLVYKILGEA
ncbi:MAG: DUF512 domain-containing protein [Coprococcus sp.]